MSPIRGRLASPFLRVAIETLRTLDLPVLLPWSDGEPITGPWESHLRGIFRNVAPPLVIARGGHSPQEDAEEAAAHVRDWMAATAKAAQG